MFPYTLQAQNKNIIFPRDGREGGSWIASSDTGVSACLLNGAFERHERIPPYRISRGLMVLDAIECIRPEEFVKNYDFNGIEPFTLLLVFFDTEDQLRLMEFRWDGDHKYIAMKDATKPHIWSSSTLYSESVRQTREGWFQDWLGTSPSMDTKTIMDFHMHGGSANDVANRFRMARPEADYATRSITSIEMDLEFMTMTHHDLETRLQSSVQVAQEAITNMVSMG